VTALEWILLALTLACVAGAVGCVIGARCYTRQTQASVRRTRAATRRAWGALAEIQLGQLKSQRAIDGGRVRAERSRK
jgi:hypothetical protein